MKKLGDAEARVQFFAAQSLGKLGNEASAAPLLALLRANDNKDAYVRHAASYALSQIRPDDALANAAKDSSAAVRLGVLLAYRHMNDPRIATFLNDADAFIVREAAEAINDAPIDAAMAPLAGKLASAPVKDEPLVVRALNANFRLGDAPRAQALANYALNEKATPEMRAEALKQLAVWGKVPQRDRVVGIYPAHEGAPGRRCRRGACARRREAAGRHGVPSPCNSPRSKRSDPWSCATRAPALVAIGGERQGSRAGAHRARCKTLDTLGSDQLLQAVSAAEKSSRSRTAPGGAADRGQAFARARDSGHQAIRRQQVGGGAAGGVPGHGAVAGRAVRAVAGGRHRSTRRGQSGPGGAGRIV